MPCLALRTSAGCILGLCLATPAGYAQRLQLIPRVEEIAVDTLPDVAEAAVDLPTPVILYNPVRLRRFGPLLAEFFIAHEYGHIYYHHTRAGLGALPDQARDSVLLEQELAADCYAAAALGQDRRQVPEAAIRFFTRLGPFRFDAVHPTGAQRSARLLACLPSVEAGRASPSGDNGVETGPVGGEPWPITFRVSAAGLEGSYGREVLLWIDGVRIGRISNMRFPSSILIDRFPAGLHSYRLSMEVYTLDGSSQLSPSGTLTGTGHFVVGEGDEFSVGWKPGTDPALSKRP